MKQTFDFIKFYWQQLLLIITVIILLSIIFQGCEREKALKEQAKADNQAIQKLAREMAESNARFAQDSAEKEAIIKQYDTLILDMTSELEQKEGSVRGYISRIKRLQDGAIQVKTVSDTTEYVRKMDSAAAEFDQLAEKYVLLEASMSELITTYSAKDTAQQQYIQILKAQLDKTREAYLEVLEKYNLLYKDFGKVARKARHRQLLNKILAGATLTTGTLLILK
mgnify:CR=1 FL=1